MALKGDIIVRDGLRYASLVTDASPYHYQYYFPDQGRVGSAGNLYNNNNIWEPWGSPYDPSSLFPGQYSILFFKSSFILPHENTLNYGNPENRKRFTGNLVNTRSFFFDDCTNRQSQWFIHLDDISFCTDCLEVNKKFINPDWDAIDARIDEINIDVAEDENEDEIEVGRQEVISLFNLDRLFGHCRNKEFKNVGVVTNEETFSGSFITERGPFGDSWTYASEMYRTFPSSDYAEPKQCPGTRLYVQESRLCGVDYKEWTDEGIGLFESDDNAFYDIDTSRFITSEKFGFGFEIKRSDLGLDEEGGLFFGDEITPIGTPYISWIGEDKDNAVISAENDVLSNGKANKTWRYKDEPPFSEIFSNVVNLKIFSKRELKEIGKCGKLLTWLNEFRTLQNKIGVKVSDFAAARKSDENKGKSKEEILGKLLLAKTAFFDKEDVRRRAVLLQLINWAVSKVAAYPMYDSSFVIEIFKKGLIEPGEVYSIYGEPDCVCLDDPDDCEICKDCTPSQYELEFTEAVKFCFDISEEIEELQEAIKEREQELEEAEQAFEEALARNQDDNEDNDLTAAEFVPFKKAVDDARVALEEAQAAAAKANPCITWVAEGPEDRSLVFLGASDIRDNIILNPRLDEDGEIIPCEFEGSSFVTIGIFNNGKCEPIPPPEDEDEICATTADPNLGKLKITWILTILNEKSACGDGGIAEGIHYKVVAGAEIVGDEKFSDLFKAGADTKNIVFAATTQDNRLVPIEDCTAEEFDEEIENDTDNPNQAVIATCRNRLNRVENELCNCEKVNGQKAEEIPEGPLDQDDLNDKYIAAGGTLNIIPCFDDGRCECVKDGCPFCEDCCTPSILYLDIAENIVLDTEIEIEDFNAEEEIDNFDLDNFPLFRDMTRSEKIDWMRNLPGFNLLDEDEFPEGTTVNDFTDRELLQILVREEIAPPDTFRFGDAINCLKHDYELSIKKDCVWEEFIRVPVILSSRNGEWDEFRATTLLKARVELVREDGVHNILETNARPNDRWGISIYKDIKKDSRGVIQYFAFKGSTLIDRGESTHNGFTERLTDQCATALDATNYYREKNIDIETEADYDSGNIGWLGRVFVIPCLQNNTCEKASDGQGCDQYCEPFSTTVYECSGIGSIDVNNARSFTIDDKNDVRIKIVNIEDRVYNLYYDEKDCVWTTNLFNGDDGPTIEVMITRNSLCDRGDCTRTEVEGVEPGDIDTREGTQTNEVSLWEESKEEMYSTSGVIRFDMRRGVLEVFFTICIEDDCEELIKVYLFTTRDGIQLTCSEEMELDNAFKFWNFTASPDCTGKGLALPEMVLGRKGTLTLTPCEIEECGERECEKCARMSMDGGSLKDKLVDGKPVLVDGKKVQILVGGNAKAEPITTDILDVRFDGISQCLIGGETIRLPYDDADDLPPGDERGGPVCREKKASFCSGVFSTEKNSAPHRCYLVKQCPDGDGEEDEDEGPVWEGYTSVGIVVYEPDCNGNDIAKVTKQLLKITVTIETADSALIPAPTGVPGDYVGRWIVTLETVGPGMTPGTVLFTNEVDENDTGKAANCVEKVEGIENDRVKDDCPEDGKPCDVTPIAFGGTASVEPCAELAESSSSSSSDSSGSSSDSSGSSSDSSDSSSSDSSDSSSDSSDSSSSDSSDSSSDSSDSSSDSSDSSSDSSDTPFSCPGGDPWIDVTVTWTGTPTGVNYQASNPSYGGAETIDMFGETWTKADELPICPTAYRNSPYTQSNNYWTYNTGIEYIHIRGPIRCTPTTYYGATHREYAFTPNGARFAWRGGYYNTASSPPPALYGNTNMLSINTFTGTHATGTGLAYYADFQWFGGSFVAQNNGTSTISVSWDKCAGWPSC